MHLTIKERVELVLMSGADGVCYYCLNCFICFDALFMAQNVCYYYLNCFICFGALFMAQNVCYYYLNCFICFGALFMAHPVFTSTALFYRQKLQYLRFLYYKVLYITDLPSVKHSNMIMKRLLESKQSESFISKMKTIKSFIKCQNNVIS